MLLNVVATVSEHYRTVILDKTGIKTALHGFAL